MRKLSRFGAAALALALSVTFLTPVQAQAAKNENEKWLNLKEDFKDSDGVIVEDKITIADVSGTGVDEYEAKHNASKNIIKALCEKGLVTTTKPACDCDSEEFEGTTYYFVGKNIGFDTETSGYDEATKTFTCKGAYGIKYTNTQTKKSSIFRAEVDNNYTADEAKARTIQSAVRVKKGEITYIAVALEGGDTEITNVKSSKKNIAKASLYKKMSSETTDTTEVNVKKEEITDPTTKKVSYTVYYYTTVGAKVVVGTYEKEEDADKARKEAEATASSSAVRYIKVDAKKTGKSKLSFKIKNKNGSIASVSTTLYVVDDDDAFKTLTYAGQSLLHKDLDKKSFYEKASNVFYTTKAKGKLVLKANKNIVIKKIEVGKLYAKNYDYGISGKYPDGSDYDYSDRYSEYSSKGKETEHWEDLNGDGDFDDIVNGVNEKQVSYKYKKTKSGKTLKLSKVGERQNSSINYKEKYKNYYDEYGTFSNNEKDRNFSAPTRIRITYYDKLLKNYETATYTIRLKVSK